MRTRVHVDGFNLYYGAVKGTPYKWLDPIRLSTLLLPKTCVLDRLLYFTAHVSGMSDPDAPVRQHACPSALRTLPEVEIHFGSFLARAVWRRRSSTPCRAPGSPSLLAGELPSPCPEQQWEWERSHAEIGRPAIQNGPLGGNLQHRATCAKEGNLQA